MMDYFIHHLLSFFPHIPAILVACALRIGVLLSTALLFCYDRVVAQEC